MSSTQAPLYGPPPSISPPTELHVPAETHDSSILVRRVLDPFVPQDDLQVLSTCRATLEPDGSLHLPELPLGHRIEPYFAFQHVKQGTPDLEAPESNNTFSAYHLKRILSIEHDDESGVVKVLTVVSQEDARAAECRRIQGDGAASDPTVVYVKTYQRFELAKPTTVLFKHVRDPFLPVDEREVIATCMGTVSADGSFEVGHEALGFGSPGDYFTYLDTHHTCIFYPDSSVGARNYYPRMENLFEYSDGLPCIIVIKGYDAVAAQDRRFERLRAQNRAEKLARRKRILAYPAVCLSSLVSTAKRLASFPAPYKALKNGSKTSIHEKSSGMSSSEP
ncbi:hypothetical protein Hypma_013210 [Hypsizygus marmoreus]|uniref:Uncharacterized protein n=1 Tax=Hypsizygus marmoreus TaxID=39966 RepID=A0A369JLR4_HYPMA|nr:hypothetical protein Hypma_013210 [Hypsizygus marmoreus]